MIWLIIGCVLLLAAGYGLLLASRSPRAHAPTLNPGREHLEHTKQRAMRAMTAERLLAEEQLQRLLRKASNSAT